MWARAETYGGKHTFWPICQIAYPSSSGMTDARHCGIIPSNLLSLSCACTHIHLRLDRDLWQLYDHQSWHWSFRPPLLGTERGEGCSSPDSYPALCRQHQGVHQWACVKIHSPIGPHRVLVSLQSVHKTVAKLKVFPQSFWWCPNVSYSLADVQRSPSRALHERDGLLVWNSIVPSVVPSSSSTWYICK